MTAALAACAITILCFRALGRDQRGRMPVLAPPRRRRRCCREERRQCYGFGVAFSFNVTSAIMKLHLFSRLLFQSRAI